MSDATYDDHDDLIPTSIEHRYEETVADGAVQALYNYLVYHFDCGNRYFWARSYLDQIDSVSVYGPFSDQSRGRRSAGETDPRILAYLRRRYRNVSIMGAGGTSAIE